MAKHSDAGAAARVVVSVEMHDGVRVCRTRERARARGQLRSHCEGTHSRGRTYDGRRGRGSEREHGEGGDDGHGGGREGKWRWMGEGTRTRRELRSKRTGGLAASCRPACFEPHPPSERRLLKPRPRNLTYLPPQRLMDTQAPGTRKHPSNPSTARLYASLTSQSAS